MLMTLDQIVGEASQLPREQVAEVVDRLKAKPFKWRKREVKGSNSAILSLIYATKH